MKTFNWEDFKFKNIAVHCETERIANDFLKEAQKMGHFLVGDNKYSYYKNNTCYTSSNCFGCWYSSVDYYRQEAYEILEWSEYMKFTKEDLMVGMLVETNDGSMLVMPYKSGHVLSFQNGETIELDNFEFNKINEVWGLCDCTEHVLDFTGCGRHLLYERPTVKEMTVEEVSKALGYDVKIVKG